MYHLFLATPEKVIMEEEIQSMIVPGTAGYFEVLKDHAPIISTLTIGKLTIRDKNNIQWVWAISGGIVEVTHNQATLLVDTIELSSDIDIERAEAALKRVEKMIDTTNQDPGLLKTNEAWQRAKNRINIANESKQ